MAERRYRLSEARALVPEVAQLLEELRKAREVLVDEDLANRLAAHAPGNGGGADSTRMAEAALSFSRGLGRLNDLDVTALKPLIKRQQIRTVGIQSIL